MQIDITSTAEFFTNIGYMLHGYLPLGSLETQLSRLWPYITFLIGIGRGITLAFFKDYRDKKLIYNWLHDKAKESDYSPYCRNHDPWWYNARDIARHNNLPVDRVVYICTIHKGIVLMGKEDVWPDQTVEEKWAAKKFVRK